MEEIKVGQKITLLHDYYTSDIKEGEYTSLWYELYAAGVGCTATPDGMSYKAHVNAQKKLKRKAKKGETFTVDAIVIHPDEVNVGKRYTYTRERKRVHAPIITINGVKYIVMSDSLTAFTVE